MLSSGQVPPKHVFLLAVEIIFAQISLETYGNSPLRPCSVTVLRMGGQPISQLTSRTCVGDSCLLEERSCSCPLGGRFSSVLACSRH